MFLFCDPDQDFPGDAEQIKWNSLDRQGGCFGDWLPSTAWSYHCRVAGL